MNSFMRSARRFMMYTRAAAMYLRLSLIGSMEGSGTTCPFSRLHTVQLRTKFERSRFFPTFDAGTK